MSVAYGGGPGAYGSPRKVNFGWIGESFSLFQANAGIWIVAVLISIVVPTLIGFVVGAMFGASTALTNPSTNPAFGGQGSAFGTPGSSPFAANPLLGGGLPPGANIGLRIFSAAWTAFFYGGVYRMAVKQVRGEPISFGDIFSGGPMFLPMLGFNIVYGLASGIGLLFCLVPGFLIMGLLLAGPALVADGAGVGGAISRSNDGMKVDMWNAAAFVFVMGLILIVSALPCGLGLFVTVPMYWLISALAYRDLVGIPGLAAPAGPSYGAPQPGVWPPPPSAGTAPPVWGQTPTQTPPPGQTPPGQTPPRTTLGGDPLDPPPPGTP